VLKANTEPEWKQIHRIADRLTPGLQAEFLAAFETLSKLLPLNELTELIEVEAFDEIGRLVQGLKLPDTSKIRSALLTAANQTAEVTATGLNMSFTLDNPAVVRWVESNTGKLITQVTVETQKAVAGIVRQGFVEGIPPRTQARQIRRIVGLTTRDAGAVDRFLRGQLEAGITRPRAESLADRMRNRLLKTRAETIARTESIRAANRGQLSAWRQAADEGLIDPTVTRRVWIATLDDRVCQICVVLDGQTVAFRDPFTSSVQAVDFTDDGDSFTIHTSRPLKAPVVEQTPPAHVRCRCATALAFE